VPRPVPPIVIARHHTIKVEDEEGGHDKLTRNIARSGDDMNKLDDYSTRWLAALLAAFPEFREHIGEGYDPGTFRIQFAAPSGSLFWVSSEDERVTVGFDAHHAHFGGNTDSVDEEVFRHAVEYIHRLMSGEYQIGLWKRDGRPAGTGTVVRALGPPADEVGDGVTVELKSWSNEPEASS
jgi:hypothetical protein